MSNSPRQRAKRANEACYMPNNPCLKCHTLSLKKVHDGSCQGCEPPPEPTIDQTLMRTAPDTIMLLAQARELGYKVYRHGIACHRNHIGWRYVKTRQCIDCLRNRPEGYRHTKETTS